MGKTQNIDRMFVDKEFKRSVKTEAAMRGISIIELTRQMVKDPLDLDKQVKEDENRRKKAFEKPRFRF